MAFSFLFFLYCAGSFVPTVEFLFNGEVCPKCGEPIDVTLRAVNEFREPTFSVSVTLEQTFQRELILLLQEAAEKDDRFNFTASYHRSLGFMVQAINKLATNFEQDGAYWQIFTESSVPDPAGMRYLCQGPSTHRPVHGDVITFYFWNDTVSLSHCPDI